MNKLFQEKNALNQSKAPVQKLLNKLFEEQRYDDLIQVYNKATAMLTDRKLNFPWLELYLDVLIEKVE
jgi:hypothetical protein